MSAPLKVDWLAIEQACAAGLTFVEASTKFEVAKGTIQKRALRHKWVLPKHVAVVARIKNEIAVQRAAEDWLSRGEQHRETAFKIATESVKKFKPKAPKSFRELEAADKIARRAAGLDTGDGVTVQTLINLNERMENHEDEQPIEATEVEVEIVADTEPAAPAAVSPAQPESPSQDRSPSEPQPEPAA